MPLMLSLQPPGARSPVARAARRCAAMCLHHVAPCTPVTAVSRPAAEPSPLAVRTNTNMPGPGLLPDSSTGGRAGESRFRLSVWRFRTLEAPPLLLLPALGELLVVLELLGIVMQQSEHDGTVWMVLSTTAGRAFRSEGSFTLCTVGSGSPLQGIESPPPASGCLRPSAFLSERAWVTASRVKTSETMSPCIMEGFGWFYPRPPQGGRSDPRGPSLCALPRAWVLHPIHHPCRRRHCFSEGVW